MGEQTNNPQLIMYASLENLPPLDLPPGMTVRHFEGGDEAVWERIIKESFQNDFDYGNFMKSNPVYKPERVLFAYIDGVPCATATAWRRDKDGPDIGYVHMVGALPEYKGRGLGHHISLAAMHELKREGFARAMLQTDDFRLAAIKTYLKLGFEIDLAAHESIPGRWEKIIGVLGFVKNGDPK